MGNALFGKVAFITGASAKRGMGRAVAVRLAQEGADVAVTDKFANPKSAWAGDDDWKGLDDVVKEIEALGRKAIAAVASVDNLAECEAAVKATIDKLGRIDILVNCAGTRGPVGVNIVDGNEKDWREMFDVNAIGTMVVSKAVGKEMIRQNQGGKIVHIASAAGKLPCPGSAAYAASKWAVIGITQALAMELAPFKINVNSINPGFFATNLRDVDATLHSREKGITVEEFRKDEYKMLSNMVPLKRMGTVEDIANLIFFLVTDQSSYLTGIDVNITGGTLMH
jgi:meso-butanediol dehydrogenase/(S,S)-butanediol dehydrogenase/diacetyl reductase